MDPGGDRRKTPLVEEPRRPPWRWIVALAAAAVLVAWIASSIRVELIPVYPDAAAPPASEAPATDGPAPDTPPPPAVASSPRPRWLIQPSPEYPMTALEVGSGEVVLNCGVQGDQTLGDCRVVDEAPGGYGFGRSAIEAAHRAKVTPDSPIGVRVQFTVRYRLPYPDEPPQAR